MKLEIELREEDAACLWVDHHGDRTGETMEHIAAEVLRTEALKFRSAFPKAVPKAVADFRSAQREKGAFGI